MACPQIRAVVSDTELDLPLRPLSLSPNLTTADVAKFDMIRGLLIVDPSGWRSAFDRWLTTHPQYFANMSADTPPVEALSLSEATRQLAGAVLWGLAQKLQRPVRVGGLRDAGHHLVPDGFFGSHLRAAADAVKAGFQGYDAQAPFYIAEAKRRNFSDIYLATGSPPHLQTFRDDAAREKMTVYTKLDFLTTAELAELQEMTWDQQALVDLDVLLHSSFFFGFCRSSFSWQIAMRRATMEPDAGTRKTGDALPKEETFRDNISAIVVHHDVDFFRSVWP